MCRLEEETTGRRDSSICNDSSRSIRTHRKKVGCASYSSECVEAKQQIIANLANFAYDPYNYVIMKELNIVPCL